jgi:WD40 repeat protein
LIIQGTAPLRHEDWVSSVAFSPDGRTLATGSGDNTARLWELEQGLADLACACDSGRFLPLSEEDRQRFGITKEWCSRRCRPNFAPNCA